MNKAQIIATQKRIGTEPDGWWGPVSTAKCQQYLRAMMPDPHPFPTQANVEAFYGPHGVEDGFTPPTKKIKLPFPIYIDGKEVTVLKPHVKCADSLQGVFNWLSEALPTTELRNAAGITIYDGIYNPRKMRGGNSWAMHSWAIAIDLNAAQNGNTDHWPTVAVMPLIVMECFAKEGWTSAGAFWSRDAMHFQATRPT